MLEQVINLDSLRQVKVKIYRKLVLKKKTIQKMERVEINLYPRKRRKRKKKKGSLLSFRLPENFGETFRALDKKKLDPLVWSSLLNNSFRPERLRTTSRESRLLFFAFFKKKKKGPFDSKKNKTQEEEEGSRRTDYGSSGMEANSENEC